MHSLTMCDLVSHDRHRHGPLPDAGASDLLGAVLTRGQRVRQPQEGQRRHRNRQPLPGPGGGRGRGRRAGRTETILGERYRRIARRRGKEGAIVAVGRSILVIVWALRSGTEAQSSTSARAATPTASTPNAESPPRPGTTGLGYAVPLNRRPDRGHR